MGPPVSSCGRTCLGLQPLPLRPNLMLTLANVSRCCYCNGVNMMLFHSFEAKRESDTVFFSTYVEEVVIYLLH